MTNTVRFPNLGLSFDVNNVAFTIFGVEIYWYGVIIAAAFALAVVFGLFKAKKVGLDSDRVIDVIIVGFIGGIIGARLYYVAFKFDDYKDNLLKIFDIREGGLAVYGGLILAVAAGILMCKIRKVKILPMLDIAVMGFLLGQGIGRWANFVNVEAYGSPTALPWGMSSESISSALADSYAVPVNGVLTVHPTFLYESLWCLLGFVLVNIYFKHRKYDGQIFLMYGVWYGAERFFVEGLRTDSLYVGPLRVSQIVSGVIVVAAAAAMIIMHIQHKSNPAQLYVDTEESKRFIAQREERKKAKKISSAHGDGGCSDCSDNTDADTQTNTLGIEEEQAEFDEYFQAEDEDGNNN